MSSSDSEDDVPLAKRRVVATNGTPAATPAKEAPAKKTVAAAKKAPAATKPKPKPAPKPKEAPKRKRASEPEDDGDDEDDDEEDDGSDDADSDVPLSQRKAARQPAARKPGAKPKPTAKAKPKKKAANDPEAPPKAKKGEIMWNTLKHGGVLFPPEYEPHGVRMLYEGAPVDLTPEQEEVASMFAVMKETDYMSKPVFLKNFWDGFKELLGPGHVIKQLDKCDFTPMFDHFNAQKELKKNMTKEEKLKLKQDKDEAELKYKTALVDGRVEQVGNFRVEPPGLFRGRGEHPKMGRIKKRVYPRDITINIGPNEEIPTHPFRGQDWKEVRHDQTVTWLAYWKDTVSPSDYKYVFLAATSTFKADSDLAKYEKARKLKDLIGDIRTNYERDWSSGSFQKRQMACALYFIDVLALRAGHEKDDDEADTVGCCTLKCENVEMVPPNQVKFDFLGKDSIKYENTVEVHPMVYRNLEKFKRLDEHGKTKEPGSQLFDTFDATDLNKELKAIMPGLSVKVFRTYNASITLDRLLREQEPRMHLLTIVDAKKAEYDKANKEVAILCNHQRSIPKTHGTQMTKLGEELETMTAELKEMEADLKKNKNDDKLQKRVEKKRELLQKKQLQAAAKEDLKTVALGTSKINYMDPRISIAWCKRNEVPLEKIFNKSLMAKFNWAMEVEPDFVF